MNRQVWRMNRQGWRMTRQGWRMTRQGWRTTRHGIAEGSNPAGENHAITATVPKNGVASRSSPSTVA
jgi:hypothetical protein